MKLHRAAAAAAATFALFTALLNRSNLAPELPVHEPTPSSKLELREGTRALHGAAALRERRATEFAAEESALNSYRPRKSSAGAATLPTIQPTFLNTTRVAARCSSLDAPFETQLERA